jgi:hypothetical protein
MKTIIDRFNSLSEMVDYALTNPHTEADSNKESNWVDNGLTSSLENAGTVARDGWSDVRPEIDALINEVQEQVGERFSREARVVNSIAGGAVNIGRHLTGRPDSMIGFKRQPSTRHGRIVKIVYDYGANGSVPAADMLKRGAVVAVLVDTLSTLGLSVELNGETTVKIGELGTHTTLVRLHDAREPMDINSLAYAIAHPSMLRRLTFSVREISKFGLSAVDRNSHGRSTPITLADELEADVVINRIEHGGNASLMLSDPAGWVISTIKGLGLLGGD